MQRIAVRDSAEWQLGTLTNCSLDYSTNVSPYAHPALTAQRAVSAVATETGAAALSATAPQGPLLPQFATSNAFGASPVAWSALGPFALTAQAGDQISLTTGSGTYQVTITLAGELEPGLGAQAGQGLAPGSLRNGCVASILVDGALLVTLDTYQRSALSTLYLDGAQHSIQIRHSGGYNPALAPIGPVTATVGTSVASMLAPTAALHPTFVSATWRVSATGTSTYNLYKTPPGGSETLVQSGLQAGTTYSGSAYVPGTNLLVQNTTPLVSGDGATFTTDVVMLAVASIALGTGAGSGAATWTSPVYDFGDPGTQMLVAEQVQSTPLASVLVRSGNTSTPDGTWSALAPARLSSATVSDGTHYGTAGLVVAPPGRYGQLTLGLAAVGTSVPWVRELVLYAWNPARDRVGSRLALHAQQQLGPLLASYVGCLATHYADTAAAKDALRAAGSIGGATDAYLRSYLEDLGLEWVSGEPKEAARSRARTVLSLAGGALSIAGIAQQLNLLVTGQVQSVSVSGTTGKWVATCGGTLVRQLGTSFKWTYDIVIPSAPYAGLPGLPVGTVTTPGTANYLIFTHAQETLRPLGGLISSIFFTTSS